MSFRVNSIEEAIYWENIMKRKLITTILTLSLCLSCFTACSFNAKKVSDNIGKGNESDLPEAEDVVIDDKDDMYNIGDEIDVKTVEYGTDREYIEKCYTVNSVKLYDTAAEVDGVSDNLIEIDYYMGADPEKPKLMKKEEVASGKFLYCDVSVKNVEDNTCTIGDISLVYEVDGACRLVGSPVYFSAAKDLDNGNYDYNLLQGQSMDVQLGWCVDPDLLQISDMDMSKLYLAVNFNGEEENRQYIKLGLE